MAVVIFFVTACFCRSNRDQPNDPGTTANKASGSTPTPNSDKKPSSSPDTSAGDKEDKGDFTVDHIAVKSSKYVEIDKQVKSERLLEKAADQLNKNLILPYDLELRTEECGQANAFYDSNDTSVTVCYELMEHFYDTFRGTGMADDKAYDKMFDAVRFVFLHEIGHALTDTYKLPITGNEEDAADRCSAFINLTELGDDGVRAVLAAADSFKIESKRRTADKSDLADEHLLQEQRFYNSLCMIYGSNPSKYSNIVTDGYLPKARAERCESEFTRTAESWATLLKPWRKG
ncbi:MAG: hypothetical protein KA956_06520 [Pyrinomonadaceae bacterium]|nr:hypothetical protein [Pyrinomonadaceae bacterium]